MTSLPIDLSQFLSHYTEPLFLLDEEGLILHQNEAAESLIKLFENSEILEGAFGEIDKAHQKYRINPEVSCSYVKCRQRQQAHQELLNLSTDRGVSSCWEVRVVPLKIMKAEGMRYLMTFRDMTELQRVETRLNEVEERYTLAAGAANDALWDYNLTTDRVYYAPRFNAMLGYADERLEPSIDIWFTKVHPDDMQELQIEMTRLMSGTAMQFENEHRLQTAKGDYRWVRCRGASQKDEHDAVVRIAGSLTDIHEKKQLELQLTHDASHDDLTGLPNRSLFMEHLQVALSRAERVKDYVFAVLFFDFDRFKMINDSYGHHIGDLFLKEISRRMEEQLRGNDVVSRPSFEESNEGEPRDSTLARMGGDEFTILLDGIRGIHDAVRVANRLQEVLSQPYELDELTIHTTTSIGIVSSDMGYTNALDILRDADTAMYRAKQSGRGCHVVFDDGMHQQVSRILTVETDLRIAIQEQQIELYYQPIVDLESGMLVGLEALARWNHPQRGLVEPLEFIGIAEDSGMIVQLGRQVFQKACEQLCDWHQRIPDIPLIWISVNLSKKQLGDEGLVDFLRDTMQTNQIHPKQMRLEITESVVSDGMDHTIGQLEALRELGIPLMMDDFGAGQSSLSRLHQFPLDALKIDKDFVLAMQDNRKLAAVVQAIISLAHNFNLTVIAEGVEDHVQLAQVIAMGSQFAQGFHFSRPQSAAEIEKFLLNQSFV